MYQKLQEVQFAYKKWTTQYKRYDTIYDFIVEAQMHSISKQDPYFSLTGYGKNPKDRNDEFGGCCHENIVKAFPSLEPYIKWHLFAYPSGPMHYIANTIWHAGNKDCWGLEKGEFKQLRNGKTGKLSWKTTDVTLTKYVDANERPTETQLVVYEPWGRTGEGKERDFDAARKCAVWPDVTDETLSLPGEELAKLLVARLPGLLDAFEKDMNVLFDGQLTWIKREQQDDHV
jgi:hypothetical protein